jgi:hypothetical protein
MTPIFNKGSTTAQRTGAIYVLLNVDGIWKLANRTGELYTARGRYNFVRKGGRILVSKAAEHIHLSGGLPVEYAGEVRFGYNRISRGRIRSWSNASGHYQPPPSLAHQAGFPMDLFEAIEHS